MNIIGLLISIAIIAAVVSLIFVTRRKSKKVFNPNPKITFDSSSGKDDLTLIEGIGPKIQTMLERAGINTFGDLAQADPAKLKQIMETNHIRHADPTTWPKQSQLLAEGKLDELKKYQEVLKSGRKG